MESWIDRYCTYTSHQVSPLLFHRWVAIATLGAAMGRKVWLDRGGYFKAYPGQMMVVLVGKSASMKKTTAGRLGMELLRVLPPHLFYMLPSKLSPQQLLVCLQRLDDEKVPIKDPETGKRVDGCGFVWAGELGKFFSKEAFAETLATHINDLNDAPEGQITMEFRSWKGKLWCPCVGMLGCITPKGIAEELPSTARTAGFFGRTLWVCQNYSDRKNALVDRPPQLKEQRAWLEAELLAIAEMRGPFGWTKQSKAWFKAWYDDIYHPATQQLEEEGMNESGYWGRKDSHLIRVAMVVSASQRRDRRLTVADCELALTYLNEVERYFPQAMAEIGVSELSEYDRRLLSLLERRGMEKPGGYVTEQRALQFMWRFGGGTRRFTESCETLSQAGEIERRRFRDVLEWRRVYKSGALMRKTDEEKEGDYDADPNDHDDPHGDG